MLSFLLDERIYSFFFPVLFLLLLLRLRRVEVKAGTQVEGKTICIATFQLNFK
jgi:hypothetical protein